MLIAFSDPVDHIEIDILFTDDDKAFLRVYDESWVLLEEVFGEGDGRGLNGADLFFRAVIDRPLGDIAFAEAGGVASEGVFLDNLRINLISPP